MCLCEGNSRIVPCINFIDLYILLCKSGLYCVSYSGWNPITYFVSHNIYSLLASNYQVANAIIRAHAYAGFFMLQQSATYSSSLLWWWRDKGWIKTGSGLEMTKGTILTIRDGWTDTNPAEAVLNSHPNLWVFEITKDYLDPGTVVMNLVWVRFLSIVT